jgi:hypothetical protein
LSPRSFWPLRLLRILPALPARTIESSTLFPLSTQIHLRTVVRHLPGGKLYLASGMRDVGHFVPGHGGSGLLVPRNEGRFPQDRPGIPTDCAHHFLRIRRRGDACSCCHFAGSDDASVLCELYLCDC